MKSSNKVYRKEDILKMQKDGVNSELGHNKQPYSIWLHKGGVNCYCTWERQIYIKRTKKELFWQRWQSRSDESKVRVSLYLSL